MDLILKFIPSVASILSSIIIVVILNSLMGEKFSITKARISFRRSIKAVVWITGVFLFLLFLPVDPGTKEQLFKIIGGIFTALIAFSSTTFFSNLIAGLMLRVIKGFRTGDYIEAGDFFGRVTEISLLSTEIQTIQRDLVSLPSLFLVQKPVRTLRNSGTIISTDVSLGYDESNNMIKESLMQAAGKIGLENTWVSIISLNDYSVSYRVNGLLKDMDSLISKRSKLNEEVMNTLHSNGIEIVSPMYQNVRTLTSKKVVPAKERESKTNDTKPEDILFDKALEAQKLEELKIRFDELTAEEEQLKSTLKSTDKNSQDRKDIEKRLNIIDRKQEILKNEIMKRESK